MGARPSKGNEATTTILDWSTLPPELLDLVLRRLPSLADRLRFATVCRHWCHAATRYRPPGSLPRVLPWINFRDGTFQSLPDGELHSFHFRGHVVCVGSFGNRLLFERPDSKPSRRFFLKNPLFRAITRLPGRFDRPVRINPDGYTSTNFFIDKVIVCSGDLIAAKVTYGSHPYNKDIVACCRPGMSSWSTGQCNGYWYQDMAFYMGKLYTVTAEGDLFAHEVTEDRDTGEPWVSGIEHVIGAPLLYDLDGFYYAAKNCVRTCYLVVSSTGKLLMVKWIVPIEYYSPDDSTKQMTLKVFEEDIEKSQWLEVKSIGDQVMFVSSNSSKAFRVSSPHCGYIQGNKIYFIDDGRSLSWPFRAASSKPRSCGVYDLSSNAVYPTSMGEARISDQSKGSWFFPSSLQLS